MSDATLARAYGWAWLAVAVLGLAGGAFGLVLVTLPAAAAGFVALVGAGSRTGRVVVAAVALGVAAFFALAELRYADRAEGLVRDYGSALHNHAFPHAAAVLAAANALVGVTLLALAVRRRA